MSKIRIFAAVAMALGSAAAQATITQLAGPGAMTTTFVNDFETAVNVGPVTFNSGTHLRTACSASSCVTTSGLNGLQSQTAPDTITATLSGDYKTVGMYFGNDDTCCSNGFSALLQVYNGATLLGGVSVVANMNDYVDQFIGLSSTTAFDKVTISYGGASLFGFIDDFRIGPSVVPEPASWAMLIAGFGLTGAAMRRHRVTAAIA